MASAGKGSEHEETEKSAYDARLFGCEDATFEDIVGPHWTQ
jgi:hypothetical protein